MNIPYKAGTKKANLLTLLTGRTWRRMDAVLKAGGYNYTARLSELRQDGYVVETKRDPKDASLFWYRLRTT